MIYIHLIDKSQKVLFSNLKPNYLFHVNFSDEFEERVLCPVEEQIKRHALISGDFGKVYVALYNAELTSRNFKKYLEVVLALLPNLKSLGEQSEKNQTQQIRRLKHNLVNYNANILQQLYKLIPQESLFNKEMTQLETIESKISQNTREASYAFLRVLKSANLMKAEFDVYDMLNTKDPYLDFHNHGIHKVVTLTLNSFWLDLIEKDIVIEIDKSETMVNIDYKSISVALCHIFDNTTKYTLPDTSFRISFHEDEHHVFIGFKMISLKIEEDEEDRLFIENISGKWPRALGVSGNGIGMTVVKRIIELNDGILKFVPNYSPEEAKIVNGIPYEENYFEIRLNKSY